MWESHLKGILKKMDGEEILEYPGNFYFKGTGLMLSTYVDDVTLDIIWSVRASCSVLE